MCFGCYGAVWVCKRYENRCKTLEYVSRGQDVAKIEVSARNASSIGCLPKKYQKRMCSQQHPFLKYAMLLLLWRFLFPIRENRCDLMRVLIFQSGRRSHGSWTRQDVTECCSEHFGNYRTFCSQNEKFLEVFDCTGQCCFGSCCSAMSVASAENF